MKRFRVAIIFLLPGTPQSQTLSTATFAAGCGRYARLDELWGKLRK